MNFIDSQLSKSVYLTFSQFLSALNLFLNNHELLISSYDEQKLVDHNFALLGVKMVAKVREEHSCGGASRNNNFSSEGRGFILFGQRQSNNNHNNFNFA